MNEQQGRYPRPILTATHYGWLAAGVCSLTVYGSLLPFHFQPQPLDQALAAWWEMTYFQPSMLEARGDWIISIVQYLVLGFLLMGALAVDRPARLSRLVALAIIPSCVLLSVFLEFTQVFFPPRTVSINDIVVESLGAVAGVLSWLCLGQRLTGWLRNLHGPSHVAGLAEKLLPAYVLLLLILELMPFDFIVDPHELALKYHEGKIVLVPFDYPQSGADVFIKVLANMAGFFPLGFLKAVAATRQTKRPSGWLTIVLPGLGVAAVIETLQLLVYSRFFDVTDILTGTLAVWLGWQVGEIVCYAWSVYQWKKATSGARRPGLASSAWLKAAWVCAFLGWLLTVIWLNWRPWNFTTEPARFAADSEDMELYGLRRMALLPFADYYWGSKYNALDQIAKKGASFLPLGVLLAFGRPGAGSRTIGSTVLAAALLAGVVETGRYFLPAHVPSVTDMVIECTAAVLGFLVVRYLERMAPPAVSQAASRGYETAAQLVPTSRSPHAESRFQERV
jgi:glycopeptide antibiotics resistance protein